MLSISLGSPQGNLFSKPVAPTPVLVVLDYKDIGNVTPCKYKKNGFQLSSFLLKSLDLPSCVMRIVHLLLHMCSV